MGTFCSVPNNSGAVNFYFLIFFFYQLYPLIEIPSNLVFYVLHGDSLDL